MCAHEEVRLSAILLANDVIKHLLGQPSCKCVLNSGGTNTRARGACRTLEPQHRDQTLVVA